LTVKSAYIFVLLVQASMETMFEIAPVRVHITRSFPPRM
jgi:hypothetical protein